MALTINGMVLTDGISCAGELLVEFVQHLNYCECVHTPAAQPDSAYHWLQVERYAHTKMRTVRFVLASSPNSAGGRG